ncbi:response regulator transcription factor [Halopseudomonas xiamenensis]|uniref:response regulator transcription factor n=1 Tax=Halopseudomonas xiamenensis TaxID=157792 RepID=UPI0016231C1A|nr:helix-turn-helix domain-containing protein [Halopseudomonas xiamenensis]
MRGISALRDSHILVIHPRPEELRILLSQLQAAGTRLSMATTSRQGLQRAQVLSLELILLNMQMPKMDGLALCRLFREAPATRHTPVIFLSAASTVDERLQGFALGAADYVTQPFVPEEVIARICIHLARGERHATRLDQSGEKALQDTDEITLRATMRLIDQQLDSPPPLVDMARLVGTHGKRLTAIFRRRLGLTVYAYIREQRLRRSQELLARSDATIQDIAELIGFRSAANFATSFRERTGMTPSAFRQQIRNGGAIDCANCLAAAERTK